MSDYVHKQLTKYKHKKLTKSQDCLLQPAPRKYGDAAQELMPPDNPHLLPKNEQKFI